MTDVTIITEPLGGSALSRLMQDGGAPPGWRGPLPSDAAGWRSRSERRRAEGDWGARLRRLAAAFGDSASSRQQLARVIEGRGVVVTTGQQPGLFGGPVYTWSKAVSAIALAAALERATGVPTVAVYWAATDDADFAEASATIVARQGGAQRVRAALEPPAGTPMSLAPLGDLSAALEILREAAGSAADPAPLDAVIEAYADPSRTAGDAFVAVLRAMLEPLGMPVLDASHPAVLDASRDVVERARQAAHDLARALQARAQEIAAAGYEPQVTDQPDASLVFVRDGSIRRRLSVREAPAAPDQRLFTPNVLLRPVVEHEILPTVAYVAGPGEAAYFAQVGAVADTLGVAPPLCVPRWSCTLVEPRVQRLLDRHAATIADVAAADQLEGRVARAHVSGATSDAVEAVRRAVAGLPDALGDDAGALGLAGAVQGATQSLHHRLDRLERRFVAGVKRREADAMRDIGTLRGALHPFGLRQERALNLVPLLARHGRELLAEMRDAAAPHADALVSPAAAGGAATA